MLTFYWNGIKDNGGKLQTCFYSAAPLIVHPEGTITIYKRGYEGFSAGIRDAFMVENDSDYQSDYVVTDTIRVEPTHPLYSQVKRALDARTAHMAKLEARRAMRQLNARRYQPEPADDFQAQEQDAAIY